MPKKAPALVSDLERVKLSSSTLPHDIEKIKVSGDALFQKGKYSEAILKYTEAIDKVDNALLYGRRAACYLALELFIEATTDASKATTLDPDFAKAWACLAEAHDGLEQTELAKTAYNKAIDSVIKMPVTGANVTLLEEFQDSLEVLEALELPEPPWNMAEKMKPPPPPHSSAWIINAARKKLDDAVKSIMEVETMPDGKFIGIPGGLRLLTDAVLMDDRCFRDIDMKAFLPKYNDYLKMESEAIGSFLDTQEPEEFIHYAKQRLAEGNWDSVRPAIDFAVRRWLLRTMLGAWRHVPTPMKEVLKSYENLINTLELGLKEWRKASVKERGVVIHENFARVVRTCYMRTYSNEAFNNSKDYTLDGLLALANDIVKEVDRVTWPSVLPEGSSAIPYFNSPKAEALSIVGRVKAAKHRLLFDDPNLIPVDPRTLSHTQQQVLAKKLRRMQPLMAGYIPMAESYEAAAKLLPNDDERYAVFLARALRLRLQTQKLTLRDMFTKMTELRRAKDRMRKIWLVEVLQDSGGGHGLISLILNLEVPWRNTSSSAKELDLFITLPMDE